MITAKPIPEFSEIQKTAFWGRVDIDMYDTDACWPWKGARQSGYGIVCIARRNFKAHRVAYAIVRGDVSPDLTLDHLCRNRACCNPAHLEPVTGKVNTLRGESRSAQNARKTHCPRGHALTADNIRPGRSGRDCLACARLALGAKASRMKGRCVQCHKASDTYRCKECRAKHNRADRSRKR